jgi:hypothetical protein
LQIPGKAYAYIATRRPIVALTGMTGATAELLRQVDSSVVVDDRDVDGIIDGLSQSLEMPLRNGDLSHFDRAVGAERLAGIMASMKATGNSALNGDEMN